VRDGVAVSRLTSDEKIGSSDAIGSSSSSSSTSTPTPPPDTHKAYKPIRKYLMELSSINALLVSSKYYLQIGSF
jgi:hypothetical protein